MTSKKCFSNFLIFFPIPDLFVPPWKVFSEALCPHLPKSPNVLLPALSIGLAFSKVIPGIADQGSLQFGVPGLEWLLGKLIFPGVATGDIYLHPAARAAWVGMLATALNLLPVGQLDGGHILYAFFPGAMA